MNTTQSEALFARAQEFIPGGVNSPVRAFRAVGGTPRFIARGAGSHIYDVDGNEYVDYICSWGPLLLGHRPKPVIEAISSVLEIGTSFGAPTGRELELAEMIIDAVPSIEMVRLVNSGTEACMSALRLARGITGRDLTVKFEGCYHGHVDSLLVKAGSGVATLSLPDTAGVPKAFSETTIALPFNDLDQVETTFRKQGDRIACVIVEPVCGNMGCVPPEPGFLHGLRRVTHQYGALLIFDEVMTGFRLSRGGAQAVYNVMPDITTLGKIIGGGLPIAAYGGRADLMKCIAPVGSVYQAGTLSGNPIAVSAGIAMLNYIEQQPELYDALEQATAQIVDTVPDGFCANRAGSMFTIFFQPGPVRNYDEAKRSDTARFGRFFHTLLQCGVYFPPSQFEAAFVSAAHTPEDVTFTRNALSEALASAQA
jgi:glutamate-1-semialdehyde 2,1-aminomutase